MAPGKWNRKSIVCAFPVLGALTAISLLLAAIDIGLTRKALSEDGYTTDPYYFSWALSALLISLGALLTFLIGFPLAIKQKANGPGIAFACILWTLGFLGLFGYGCYYFHYYPPSDFESYCDGSDYCASLKVEFAVFLFTPFDAVACACLAIVAFRTNSRKYAPQIYPQAGEQAWPAPPPAYPQQSQPYQMQPQPYTQQQQPILLANTQPSSITAPHKEKADESRPLSEAPASPVQSQPFYQNGQWYQYQPVPMSDPSAPPRHSTGAREVPQSHTFSQPQVG